MFSLTDLARWLPDGNIEYLGRIDQQVKIRGFRIEPGEIESQLLRIAGISAATVIVREDKDGDKHLSGYIVAEPNTKPETDFIKSELRKTLPEYMVPTYIMELASIPLTRNGKLDKAALPIAEYKAQEYILPRNTKEKQVTEAFEKILGLNRVSITDNFFDLGGDSIKAIRILSKIREAGYESTIRNMIRLSF